jgi:uncharacterized protein HemY
LFVFFQMVVVLLTGLQRIAINVGNVPFYFCELPPWRIRRRRRRRRRISSSASTLQCGLFTANLKEISRASSYGDRE